MHKKILLISTCVVIFVIVFNVVRHKTQQSETKGKQANVVTSGSFDKNRLKIDAEWKKILTPEQFHILREQGTEIPFTGVLDHEKRKGTYYSVGCDEPVFRSEQKYDSGTGWPSFWDPINKDALILQQNNSFGQMRIEVLDKCGGHLGHLFDDGPSPTGKRYCMNSEAMYFVPDKN